VAVSPLDLHAASPAELQQRVLAERRCSAFLVLRDGDGQQRIIDLAGHDRLSIGRRPSSDIVLSWDREVSRLHAELVRCGTDWFECDDGLSHNGTFVGGERVHGRRRLRDGDVTAIGATLIAFVAAPGPSSTAPTITSARPRPEVRLTPAQRRVLVALCRPYRDSPYAAPPTNREIAGELVLAVDTVKATLRQLFERFALDDLPQNQKRAALAAQALATAIVSRAEL
jgi:pSer/pThr/pTyr-binding forkhead associated (FHA) protein